MDFVSKGTLFETDLSKPVKINVMNHFGFFREFEHGLPSGLSIHDFISDKPYDDKQRVIDYLRAGNILIACAGVVHDVLDEDKKVAGVPNVVTDGEWLWSGDLPYYIENYNVKPPQEMLLHMESNGWTVPKLKDEELIPLLQHLGFMK
jgi:hypothetical protein